MKLYRLVFILKNLAHIFFQTMLYNISHQNRLHIAIQKFRIHTICIYCKDFNIIIFTTQHYTSNFLNKKEKISFFVWLGYRSKNVNSYYFDPLYHLYMVHFVPQSTLNLSNCSLKYHTQVQNMPTNVVLGQHFFVRLNRNLPQIFYSKYKGKQKY